MRLRSKLFRRSITRIAVPLVLLVFCFALSRSLRLHFEPVAQAATLIVTNTNDDGPGSLRNAITVSNLSMGSGINAIGFNIPGSGVHTITPLSPLPVITAAVSIDGLSQPGASATNPLIELNGSSAGANADGLAINGGHCFISGLVINRFKGAGINLQSGETNFIGSNRLGTDPSGQIDRGNGVSLLIERSGGNDIRSNLISGNDGPGVWIHFAGASGNTLIANWIGTNATATVALGNITGVAISDVPNNIIGPPVNVSSDVNIIAGNSSDGISINGNHNLVRANLIGTNGASAIPNGHDGINILSGAANTIGGTDPTMMNVISGNGANGIEITGIAAVGNQIIGNRIGVDASTLLKPLPNGANGILTDTYASNNTIGGPNTFNSRPGNFIAYNNGSGVRVEHGFDNKIIENYIHDNVGAGVFVNWPDQGEDATSILGNRIFNDGGLAIDLAPTGVTPNDPGDGDVGANRLQNFPVISSAAASQGRAFIKGTLNSKPNSTYRLEFFVSNACDGSAHGEAEGFIGFASVTTDGNGDASFGFSSGNGTDAALAGQVVSATATDSEGNTSELSQCTMITEAGLISMADFNKTVSETSANVSVVVRRTGDGNSVASVDYATSDGNATAGSDYSAVSGTLNFAVGELQKTITVPIINDSLAEGVEVFHVNLSNTKGGPGLGLRTTDVIIDDDEVPSRNFYAITNNNELLTFNTAQGGPTPLAAVQIVGEKILEIDIRPATGQLYGLGLNGHLFTIDKTTGALTQVGTAVISGLTEFPSTGFDFNPVTDRLRVVIYDGRNLQLNPDTGAVSSTDSNVAFATGDPNAGVRPLILGLANANNFAGATTTTTYGLNSTDAFFPTQLVTLGSPGGSPISPNTGQLFTIASTGQPTADFSAFDISDANEAFATFAGPDSFTFTELFKIDLASGRATRVNTISTPDRVVRDIALESLQRLQFSASSYSINENAGSLTITVKRNGGSSGPLSVNHTTSDGTASAGQDYLATSGTLNFADGETSKTFAVPLIDDASIEGVESVNLTLSSPTNGAVVGPQSTATIAIMDEPTEAGTNPIDNADFFVRQHYADFLSRNPDAGGLTFWTNHITQCFNDAACVLSRRVGTSAEFFITSEFQQTGFYIYRIYKAALARRPGFAEFNADRGQVVGGSNLENGKQTFATAFVQRTEFVQKYPLTQDASTFVDALIATAGQASGLTDLSTRRDSLIAQYNQGTNQTDSRVRVVRALIDDSAFSASQYNPAFVLMQYFEYLRREPDQGGYDFWLDHVNNRNPNNYRSMVCAFITSTEYQHRFGQIVTHSNRDCGS